MLEGAERGTSTKKLSKYNCVGKDKKIRTRIKATG